MSDGKKQTTFECMTQGVNIGKSNETTALEQANLSLERKVLFQREKGYRDTKEEALKSNTYLKVNFNEPLPKHLCFFKPKTSITQKKLKQLEKNNQAILTVKRDGFMHVVMKSEQRGVEIYSRRMDLVTDKYPHLIESFRALQNGTMLLGEKVLLR